MLIHKKQHYNNPPCLSQVLSEFFRKKICSRVDTAGFFCFNGIIYLLDNYIFVRQLFINLFFITYAYR